MICTYNRAWILGECLSSLTQQIDHQLAKSIEIIVVNNNSTDDTDSLVKGFEEPYIHFIQETKQGLSHARNKGLQEAKGKWVAYLDDDATARPDWIKRILDLIDSHDFAAFGGLFLPWYRNGKKNWYLDEYATNKTWLQYEEITELKSQNFSGGNCAYRRDTLLEVGGFPLELGMKGEEVAYGEETLVQQRIRDAGYTIGFDPELIIDHFVAPYKQKISWFIKQAWESGKVYWVSNGLSPSSKVLLFTLVSLIKGIFKDSYHAAKNMKAGRFMAANAIIYVMERFIRKLAKILYGIKQL